MTHSVRYTLAGICFLMLALSGLPNGFAASNWPQFRGPNGTGHAEGNLPLHWSATTNVTWKIPVPGKAWSSPIIWGEQIWLSNATADGKQLSALCVDKATGKTIFDRVIFQVEKPAFCIAFNSYASSTPTIEAGRVYLHYGSAGTACLDSATGNTLWSRRDLLCDHFRGPGSSPILYRDLLILTFDGADRQYVAALDKKTGQTVWQQDRHIDYGTTDGDGKKAFGTPSIFEVEGKPQLVSPSAMGTIAYDPLTGTEIWQVKHGGMNVAQPPLFGHGLFYLCTGDGGFRLYALRSTGHGDLTQTNVAWKTNRNAPSRCAPLLVDDLLFFNNEQGMVTCLEATTGKSLWTERIQGKFSASPIYSAGRLYFFSEDGPATVLAASREYKPLATNKFSDEGCMSSPAAVGNALIVRTKTHLYRIEEAR